MKALHRLPFLSGVLSLLTACHSSSKVPSVPASSIQLPEEAEQYILAPSGPYAKPVAAWIDETGQPVDEVLEKNGTGYRLERDCAQSPRLIVDFGVNTAGFLRIGLLSSSGARVRIAFSESLEFLGRSGDAIYGMELMAFPHIRRLPGGPCEWEDTRIRGGFRYAAISLERTGHVEIDFVDCAYTGYPGGPDSYRGYFLCGDDLLNRIWYAGVYTNQLSTFDPRLGDAFRFKNLPPAAEWVTVDGAKRDRLVWTGDLYLEMWIHLVSDYELGAITDSLDSLAAGQHRGGYIPACNPVLWWRLAGLGFDDYTAWWVLTLALYYQYTGDNAYVASRFEVVRKALDHVESTLNRRGLYDMAIWKHNWCYSVLRRGEVSYVNAVYVWCFREAAGLAAALGEHEREEHYRSVAGEIRGSMAEFLWDDDRGVLIESSKDPDHVPLDANTIGIVGGAVDREEDRLRILRYILDEMWSPWGSVTVDRPYTRVTYPYHNQRVWAWMVIFETMSRFMVGDEARAFDCVRRTWRHYLDRDPNSTFWEWVGTDGGPENAYASLCHGVSGGISAVMTAKILGMEPTEPGFRAYRVRPQPGDLDWAEGAVPTPQGPLYVSFKRDAASGAVRLDLRSPPETRGQVILPSEGKTKRLKVLRSETAESEDWVEATGEVTTESGPDRFVIRDVAGGIWRIEVE